MARLRGDDDLFSLMDEMSSQQGYDTVQQVQETKTQQQALSTSSRSSSSVSAAAIRRRLRPEIESYPSNKKPAGNTAVWNPFVHVHVHVQHTTPTNYSVPTNPQVEVFRRRAFERFKEKILQILERAAGNSTKEGMGNMWKHLQVVALMERWHFAEKLRETLDSTAATMHTSSNRTKESSSAPTKTIHTSSIQCNTQQIHASLKAAVNSKRWVDPILINCSEIPQRGGPIEKLLTDEIQFDWLRAWRRSVGAAAAAAAAGSAAGSADKEKDTTSTTTELESVFGSKKFRRKVFNVCRSIWEAGDEVMTAFQLEVTKRAEMEATQTNHKHNHKKRKNIPKLNDVEEEDVVTVSFSGLIFSINRHHYEKLSIMFDRKNHDKFSLDEDYKSAFVSSLFTLLARYDTLQGAGLQAAVPGAVFDVLLQHYDCQMECFASPLNCRYERFFSAFPDTDCVFGSLGSFFDYDFTVGGCYQANPPFVSSFIHAMYSTMEAGLEHSTKEPLMFVVFIPAWNNTTGWKVLKDSKFLVHYLLLSQSSHYYKEGTQHRRKASTRVASFDTSVFFLQNQAAKQKWHIEDSHVKDIMNAFGSDDPTSNDASTETTIPPPKSRSKKRGKSSETQRKPKKRHK